MPERSSSPSSRESVSVKSLNLPAEGYSVPVLSAGVNFVSEGHLIVEWELTSPRSLRGSAASVRLCSDGLRSLPFTALGSHERCPRATLQGHPHFVERQFGGGFRRPLPPGRRALIFVLPTSFTISPAAGPSSMNRRKISPCSTWPLLSTLQGAHGCSFAVAAFGLGDVEGAFQLAGFACFVFFA